MENEPSDGSRSRGRVSLRNLRKMLICLYVVRFAGGRTFLRRHQEPEYRWAGTRHYSSTQGDFSRRKCDVFIGILSRPEDITRRQMLRKYLTSPPRSAVRFGFFVGCTEPAIDEAYLHMFPKTISYDNISYLTLSVVEYAYSSTDCSYIMKADDDSFVNVDMLLKRLATLSSHFNPIFQKLLAGNLRKDGVVNRDRRHRHYDEDFVRLTGRTTYTPYMRGPGYIFSRALAAELLRWKDNLTFLPREDAAFGWWISGFDVTFCPWTSIYLQGDLFFRKVKRKGGIENSTRAFLKPLFAPCQGVDAMIIHGISSDELQYLVSTDEVCAVPKQISEEEEKVEQLISKCYLQVSSVT